jgi:multimeric flavodoxin WrbA
MKNQPVLLALLCAVLTWYSLRPAAAGAPGHKIDATGRPLLIYYSLTGNTRIVAAELGSAIGCERLELTSMRERTGFWKVNCVIDQLFDRDDLPGPVRIDVSRYNPIIIACPIWIHRLASPMRTFLDHRRLAGKDIYVIVTHQGNYGGKDEQSVRQFLAAQDMRLKGYGAVLTRGRTEAEIVDDTKGIIKRNFPEMEKPVSDNTKQIGG